MKFLILVLLISVSYANTIHIGIAQTNQEHIPSEKIIDILKCSTMDKNTLINITTIPIKKGLNLLKRNKIDGFFPIYINSKNTTRSLVPLYIDEVLLISKNGEAIKDKIEVGIVEEHLNHVLKDNLDVKVTFTTKSTNKLLKGLKKGRVNHILTYRSHLPPDFDIENYKLKTINFQQVGVRLSSSIIPKLNISIDNLKSNFLTCLESMSFILPESKKNQIENLFKNDSIKIAKKLSSLDYKRSGNIDETEKRWRSGDLNLINSIVHGKQSKRLKEILLDYNFINEALVFNENGALVASIGQSSDYDQSDEIKYILAKNNSNFNKNLITNIYFDASTKHYQFGLIIPYFIKNKFIGALFIGADLNSFFTFYNKI